MAISTALLLAVLPPGIPSWGVADINLDHLSGIETAEAGDGSEATATGGGQSVITPSAGRATDQDPAWQSAVTASRPLIGGWRGTYLPHGWIAKPRSEEFVRLAVDELRVAGFRHQIHNVGALDSSGAITQSINGSLADWIEASRAADPTQRILAWVSGSRSSHVNNHEVHERIVETLVELVDTGVDGLLLDFEPFHDADVQFVELLRAIRKSLPTTWIGVTAPAGEDWSADFIGEVATLVDGVSPMLYDTSMGGASLYSNHMSTELVRYRRAMPSNVSLLPSLPAFSANDWHDPKVENLATATAALALAAKAGHTVDGAFVYWWWELADAEKDIWKETLLHRVEIHDFRSPVPPLE